MSDLKSAILAADDRPFEDRYVEPWNTEVRIRGLSGHGSEEFSRKFGTRGDDDELPTGIMVDLLIRTLYDPETDERIFSDDDADALGSKSGKVLSSLFRDAQRLSGLGDLDEAKNDSGGTQDDGGS